MKVKGHDGKQRHIKIDKVNELEKLLLLRKEYAYGMQRDYLDHFNCIGWTREGIDEKQFSGCAVVMSNGNDGIKTMKVGCKHAGKIFIDYLQHHPSKVTVDENGFATFYCNAGSVSVWVEEH